MGDTLMTQKAKVKKSRKKPTYQFKIRKTNYPIYDETLQRGYAYNPIMQIPTSKPIAKGLDIQPSTIPKGPKTYQPPSNEPQPPGEQPPGEQPKDDDNKPDIEGLIDLLKPEDLSKVKNALEMYCRLFPAKCANKYEKTDKTKGLDPKTTKYRPPPANTSQETLPRYTSTTEAPTTQPPPYQQPVSQTPNYSTPDLSMESLTQVTQGGLPWQGLPLTQAPLTTTFVSGFTSWLLSGGGALVGLTGTVINVLKDIFQKGGDILYNFFKCLFGGCPNQGKVDFPQKFERDPHMQEVMDKNSEETTQEPKKQEGSKQPVTKDYIPSIYEKIQNFLKEGYTLADIPSMIEESLPPKQITKPLDDTYFPYKPKWFNPETPGTPSAPAGPTTSQPSSSQNPIVETPKQPKQPDYSTYEIPKQTTPAVPDKGENPKPIISGTQGNLPIPSILQNKATQVDTSKMSYGEYLNYQKSLSKQPLVLEKPAQNMEASYSSINPIVQGFGQGKLPTANVGQIGIEDPSEYLLGLVNLPKNTGSATYQLENGATFSLGGTAGTTDTSNEANSAAAQKFSGPYKKF
jgi:hypothetical protein